MAISRSMRQLGRMRLDQRLKVLRALPASSKAVPHGGWVRAIREALGMSRRVLGQRMGLGEKRIQQLELGEARGSIAMETLVRAAAALDCELVVALVPREPLEARVQERRARLAKDWIRTRVSHTMALEGQDIRDADLPADLIEDLERMFPDERLWDTN